MSPSPPIKKEYVWPPHERLYSKISPPSLLPFMSSWHSTPSHLNSCPPAVSGSDFFSHSMRAGPFEPESPLGTIAPRSSGPRISLVPPTHPPFTHTVVVLDSAPNPIPNNDVDRPHIPRPPNAFMLFRSDFLKQGLIPPHVERRQQNLSRVAGECWNLLSLEQKAKWQDEAAKALLVHQQKYPGYKFRPAPRGSRRMRGRGAETRGDAEQRIRNIRETYTTLSGPAASPRRRRTRPKKVTKKVAKKVDSNPRNDICFQQALCTPLPESIPASPFVPPHSSSPVASDAAPLPPTFPQTTYPHMGAPRRPSTSLGFIRYLPQDLPPSSSYSMTRPSSAASSDTELSCFVSQLDLTPRASTFGQISNASAPSSFAHFTWDTPATISPPSNDSPISPISPKSMSGDQCERHVYQFQTNDYHGFALPPVTFDGCDYSNSMETDASTSLMDSLRGYI